MKTQTFKTNINCGGCLNSVTPSLNALDTEKWEVDLTALERTLTVISDLPAEAIIKQVGKAGFKAEAK